MRDIAAALLNFSVTFLPVMAVLIPAALIAAVITYFMFRAAPDGSNRSIVRFALMGLGIAIGAGFLGMGLGIAFFCGNSLGNLCGLGGVFLTGPLAALGALAVYLIRWARQSEA